MITVSVLYPNDGSTPFDMDYYLDKHIPMVQDKLSSALRSVAVEQGLAGGAPDSSPPFVSVCHLRFDSVEAFQGAFAPESEQIMADVPNFTALTPLFQISDVRVG